MITINNYFDQITNIDFTTLPEALRKGNEFIAKATHNGESWESYHSSDAIKKTIDIYLSKLNEFNNATKKVNKKTLKKNKGKEHNQITNQATQQPDLVPSETKSSNSKKVKQQLASEYGLLLVERIPEELRFIRRFVNLNGKTKTKDEILRLINSLQKAIVEKRIRKTSTWADHIRDIQDKLLTLYNSMKQKIKIELKPETYDELKNLVGSEKVMPSINFIKRYISLNGKSAIKDKAKQLLKQINQAFDKGKIAVNDLYISEMNDIRKNLEEFIESKSEKTLQIEKATLNGLEGILGCACNQLSGTGVKPAIMNSMDFANMEFDALGFTGKWLKLIGDPSTNFTAMVYGKPKFGKSTLCLEFANYLAQNHGKVLYAAKEEGLDMTLQKKINEFGLRHPNLTVSSLLPNDLSAFDFIFLDSVNRFGLKPDDLNRLKASNPSKSFIFIFQTTKSGAFRGANTFQHDVDVVIEVPEKGKAVQMGRFNQGGEIDIFKQGQAA